MLGRITLLMGGDLHKEGKGGSGTLTASRLKQNKFLTLRAVEILSGNTASAGALKITARGALLNVGPECSTLGLIGGSLRLIMVRPSLFIEAF